MSDAKHSTVLSEAISECERFVKLARAYKPSGRNYYDDDRIGRAAAKRASLDATRALAKLRKVYASDWDVET